MDVYRVVEGVGVDAAIEAHNLDLGIQDEYEVNYRQYRVDEGQGGLLFLFEASNNEAGDTVHRKSHGLTADEI